MALLLDGLTEPLHIIHWDFFGWVYWSALQGAGRLQFIMEMKAEERDGPKWSSYYDTSPQII